MDEIELNVLPISLSAKCVAMFYREVLNFQREGREYYWRAYESIQHGRLKDATYYQIKSDYCYKKARSQLDSILILKKTQDQAGTPPSDDRRY